MTPSKENSHTGPADWRPWIVLTGGFLGAGKTTLLLAAARELTSRGLRPALVLNDQGEALADTRYAQLHGVPAREVTGGCFCCRLSDLTGAIEDLRAFAPDVILAEPVGSCTDLAATTLRPLLEDGSRVAPLTVLVDPLRAAALLQPEADPNLSFLFRKQMQEADLICFTKSDLAQEPPGLPVEYTSSIRQLSAKTGQGVAAWLDEVLSGSLAAGRAALDIDYEQYARAEAALVWLNLEAAIEPRIPCSPAMLLGPFLDRLDAAFTAAAISIVHLKAIDSCPEGFVKAALCANGEEPAVEGDLAASPSTHHQLLVNLRALGEAAATRAIVEAEMARLDATLTGLRLDCFHPAAPKPERRILTPTKE